MTEVSPRSILPNPPRRFQQKSRIVAGDAGLPVLCGLFPALARSRLRDLQEEYRGRWYDQNGIITEVLLWTTPGAVWAADFADPPAPVDGWLDHLLATRDLASSMQLAAQATLDEDARAAVAAVEELFIEYGAPLVLKSDNGSPFIAGPFRELLDRWQVLALLSPPRTPRYNGAVEAGNGAVKCRTRQEAARHDRIGCWTSDSPGGRPPPGQPHRPALPSGPYGG